MEDSDEKLIIRKKQKEALSKYMLKEFEDRMVVHLKTTFPNQTKDMPEPDLRGMIQVGVDKAKGYDIAIEEDVQQYLEYMVSYGADFDANPKMSWAGDILRTKNLDGTTKMDRIDEYELFVLKGAQP